MKLISGADRILSSHRISDKQNLGRGCLVFDLLKLRHQLVVDMQTPSRINQQRIVTCELTLAYCLAA